MNASAAQATPDSKEDRMKESRPDGEDAAARGQRVAMPEIEGCPRDNITFFRGEVRSFKRTSEAVKISIHTDWDSDEELMQTINKDQAVVYRLGGERMEERDWKAIISEEGAVKPNVRVTAWVCESGGEQTIKIIDWQLARPPA